MRHLTKILAVAAAFVAFVATPLAAQEQMARETGLQTFTAEQVKSLVADWPQTSNEAANAMIDKYGAPDGVTSTMLVWNDNGPWARTIVSKEPVQHDFPMPHEDVLEQVIYHEVPIDKIDDLARYDGSVIVERTKGTISARCDKEGANFLALNLAHDIITDDKTVDEARQAYAEAIQQKMLGQTPEYMTGFAFPMSEGDTGDPDVTTIDARKSEMSNEMAGDAANDRDPVEPADIEKEAPKPELENDEDRPNG